MKTLIMITNYFPYGNDTGEMYLKQELYTLQNYFKQILIIPTDAGSEQQLTIPYLPDNVKVLTIWQQDQGKNKKKLMLPGMRAGLCSPKIRQDEGADTMSRRLFGGYFLAKSEKKLQKINENLHLDQFSDEDIVIYSYRLFDLAYISLELAQALKKRNQVKCVCRAHRYDLYEEENKLHYLPFRKLLLEGLDLICPCSMDGVTYLADKYPAYASKILCSYLGTADYGEQIGLPWQDRLELVSCSNVIPVKQVDRIARIVQKLNQKIQVRWTHIGGGEQYEEIAREYQELIQKGLFVMPGRLPHEEVIRIYQTEAADLFINLSLSEGIPQAIMEASSFGIPTLATHVGGTAELVQEGISGYLVNVEDSDEEICNRILAYNSLSKEDKESLRQSTRSFWQTHFSTAENTIKFAELITK